MIMIQNKKMIKKIMKIKNKVKLRINIKKGYIFYFMDI